MLSARDLTNHVTDKAVALIKALHNTPIGAKEFSGGWCPERVDAILFTSCSSYLIETKISRSDFFADFKKMHRQDGCGIGNYRYYACPTGLIKPEELPEKWGLIYVDPRVKRARATMPVGHGGYIMNPKKDKKNEHGWTDKGMDCFGTFKENGHGNMIPISRVEDAAFRFPTNNKLERSYLFALSTRYKQQKFMENIL